MVPLERGGRINPSSTDWLVPVCLSLVQELKTKKLLCGFQKKISASLFQCMRKEGDDFKKDYLGYGPSTAIVTDQVFQTLTKKIHRILTKLANYAHKHISSDFLLSWLDLESFHLKGSSTPKKWCGSSSMSMSNVPMDIGQVHVQSSKSDIYTVYLVFSP